MNSGQHEGWNFLFEGCDRSVAAALRRCVNEVTELHSITSRRHSIRSIVRRNADVAVENAMAKYRGPWSALVLHEFQLSEVWSRAPDKRVRHGLNDTALERALRNARAWRRRLVAARNSAWGDVADIAPDDPRTWSHCRGANSEDNEGTSPRNRSPLERFSATLDSLIGFIDWCEGRVPARSSRSERRRVLVSRSVRYQTYCELCWRRTEYALEIERKGGAAPEKWSTVSRRFCTSHDPGNPKSAYRRDHRYKDAFQQELAALTGKARSQHSIRLTPASWSEVDLRRAAYALVRGKFNETAQKILALRTEGCSLAEIADQLRMTRRGVAKSLRALHTKLQLAEEICWGSASFPD